MVPSKDIVDNINMRGTRVHVSQKREALWGFCPTVLLKYNWVLNFLVLGDVGWLVNPQLPSLPTTTHPIKNKSLKVSK